MSLVKSTTIKFDPSLTEMEGSVRILRPALLYFEHKYGRWKLEQFILDTGLTLDYLENENNWISNKYINLFYEKSPVKFTTTVCSG